jgi:predicted Zn-dependent peptidase
MKLSELLALVDEYHITDKRLLRARAQLARGGGPEAELEFTRQAKRYFDAVARETQSHLADLDRRLNDLYQRQYNLHAERAVAQRRLEGAQRIAAALAERKP